MSICNAVGCDKACRIGRLMCYSHWAMVHPERQQLIYDLYGKNRYDFRALMRDQSYLEAVAVAVEDVAAQEGRSLKNSWRNLLNMRKTALKLDGAQVGK